jgi:hypothetical protein
MTDSRLNEAEENAQPQFDKPTEKSLTRIDAKWYRWQA